VRLWDGESQMRAMPRRGNVSLGARRLYAPLCQKSTSPTPSCAYNVIAIAYIVTNAWVEHMALGEFEQLVLLAILHLGDEAYGVAVVDAIESRTGRSVSRSSLYITFDRLESKGYLTSELRPGTGERGGKLRRYVAVTRLGLDALRESRNSLLMMWKGLKGVLETGK